MLGIEIVCVSSSKGLDPTYDIIRQVTSAIRNTCAWFKEMELRSNVVEVYSKKKTNSNAQGKSQIVWISYVTQIPVNLTTELEKLSLTKGVKDHLPVEWEKIIGQHHLSKKSKQRNSVADILPHQLQALHFEISNK